MKKILLFAFILLFSYNNTNAMTSKELFNIYYQWNFNWQDIYIVPPGKDLIINFIYTDATNWNWWWELFFKDNWFDIAGARFIDNKNNVFLVIKDLLQLKDSSSANNYVITGILVDEWEDISWIIKWNDPGINKKVFDKDTIKEIYEYEAISMIFILIFTFYFRIIWIKRKSKPFRFLFKN